MQNSSNIHVPNMMVEINCLDVGPSFWGLISKFKANLELVEFSSPLTIGLPYTTLSSSSSLQVWWGQRIRRFWAIYRTCPRWWWSYIVSRMVPVFWGLISKVKPQLSTCRTFKPNDYTFTSSGVNLKLNPKNGGTTPKKESPHYSYLLQAWREVCSDHKTTQIYTETPALSNKQLTRWGLQASVQLTSTAYNYSRDQSLGRSRSPNGAIANWDAIPRPNHKCTHDDDGKGFPSIIPPKYASQRKSPKLKPDQTTSPKKAINLSSPKTADVKTPTRSPPQYFTKVTSASWVRVKMVEWIERWLWLWMRRTGIGVECAQVEDVKLWMQSGYFKHTCLQSHDLQSWSCG